MNEIVFTKMHGLGNDYVYIDCPDGLPRDVENLAIKMSDRHKGIGGDGIILILPSEKADCMMRIFNADGSEGKMCGNGIRCVAKWVNDHGRVTKNPMTIDTLSGVKTISMKLDDAGKMVSATVDMGDAVTECPRVPVDFDAPEMIDAEVETSHGVQKLTAVSMGNPHGVIFFDSMQGLPVETLGPELEKHPMWPDRANIEMCHARGDHDVDMRVWERGSGETMACGTGACATAVASVLTGRCQWPVTVHLRGGDLVIDRDPATGHILMTGPAETVFEGVYHRRS